MDKTNLLLRDRTYYARIAVPRRLWPLIGKREIVRTLRTRDIAEARRRRHKVVHEVNEELSRLELDASFPKGTAQHVIAVARSQRKALLSGEIDEQSAEAGLDATVTSYLDKQAKTKGTDTDGDANLSESEARALRLAHKVLHGEDVDLVSEQIKRYLAEVKPRVTHGAYIAKQRQLNAFAKWIGGPHTEISAITRRMTSKYVADVVQTSNLALKTKKSWFANLRAFGSWLEIYNIAESNPWSNLSRVLKESTRGGARPQPRPYTVEEFARLVKLLPTGSPLLPMTCIAAYSGLRIDELASTKLDELTPKAFRVMKAKNTNSVRYVPIHPTIAPIVDRLRQTSSDGYLISGLLSGGLDNKRSHFASKQFGRFLRRNEFDAMLNFHSLRRSFMQRAETAGVPQSTTELLVGHARQSLTYGLYSPGPEFPKLAEEIRKVSYGKPADALVAKRAGDCKITNVSRRRRKATRRASNTA